MAEQDLEAVVLSEAMGVEVHGLALDRPLATTTATRLRSLFDAHHLLLFRDVALSPDDQLRLCRTLRPVVDPVAWISNVEAGFHPEGELLYHCDYAFTAHPMLGLSLYAVELADGAAPTCFASNVRALSMLPADVRRRLEALDVVHMIDSVNGRDNVRTRLEDVGGENASRDLFPRFARPAVWTHPVTGVSLLFVLQQQASHFDGWSCAASDELLDAAFAVLYHPENVYAHHWRPGDFIVWDNLALQHGRPANPNTVRRSLRRVAMNTVTTADLIAGTGFDPAVRARLRTSGSPGEAVPPDA
jgi:taurine dioxygenase